MKISTIVVLTNIKGQLTPYCHSQNVNVKFCSSLDEVSRLRGPKSILLTCSTGVIVPKVIYSGFASAYNIHPASPNYPGRDPHHFASYEGVNEYGATLHIMEERVDSGPIIKASLKPVSQTSSYLDLLEVANNELMQLFSFFITNCENDIAFTTTDKWIWNERKYSRKDFAIMCDVSNCNEAEFEKRVRAFSVPGYKNIYIKKFGKEFFLEK